MKKLCLILLSILCSTQAWSEVSLEPLLNKVTLQLRAEQWVTTKTAQVNVAVNAAVADQAIEKIQNDIMQQLTQFSNTAQWHIVSFDRQQDKSGLESIQILAQGRLIQSELNNLRNKAKAMSKPGQTFTISDVQFTPSEDEIKQANIGLRNNIYQQAKAEIDLLNKSYPEQKYYLHTIDFISSIQPMAMEGTIMMGRMAEKTASSPALSVGNKQTQQANVVLAAMPDQVTQKLAHTSP